MGAIPISSTKESYGKEINVASSNYNSSIGFNLCHTLYWIWLSLMGVFKVFDWLWRHIKRYSVEAPP